MTLDARLAAAARRLGHAGLRPEQAEAAAAVVRGRDVLCVMPTGSGKSLIYQVAGLLLAGPTVVISPLVALQRDQVAALEEGEEGLAAEVNAQLPEAERAARLEAAGAGEVEFVFLAPEQLANDETRARLAGAGVSLVVVDEAHCVSEWGHDFRPDYLRIAALVRDLGRPRVLALTATATEPARAEISARLALRDPLVLVHGFDRPNIHLAVAHVGGQEEKLEAIRREVAARPGPGIVYRATRAGTEALADRLRADGARAIAYHAGLAAGERAAAQAAFMDGAADVIVATVAFGMGVDKPDVRYVLHAEPPDGPDAYMQEIGRAGRDGEPAAALLLHLPADMGRARFRAAATALEPAHVAAVLAVLAAADGPVGIPALRAATGLSRSRAVAAVGRLEDVGAVRTDAGGRARLVPDGPPPARAARAAVAAQERLRAVRRTRLEMLRAYAETQGCRRAHLLAYFGEPYEPPCGACDACDAGRVAPPPRDVPFRVGARVRHAAWGEGTVQGYEDDRMTVLFAEAGYRVLGLGLVAEGDLLEEA